MTNPPPDADTVPSSQTFYRIIGLRKDFDKTLQSVYRATEAQANAEEARAFRTIIEASSAVDVVRMTTLSRGVAQLAWTQRINEFGIDALPHIVRRLRSSQSISDETERHLIIERLIGALRRLGAPGCQALLECFNNLDAYSQSLACVAFGVLETREAADLVMRFYERVKIETDTGLIAGALWGLIGLQHPQTDEVMADLMNAGRFFPEQYPFASLAGGEATLYALTRRLAAAIIKDRYKDERDDVLIALAAIGHRLGRERFRELLDESVEPEGTVQSIMELALRTPPERVSTYFKMYYANPDED